MILSIHAEMFIKLTAINDAVKRFVMVFMAALFSSPHLFVLSTRWRYSTLDQVLFSTLLVSAVLKWVRKERINTMSKSIKCAFSWISKHRIFIIYLRIIKTVDKFPFHRCFQSMEVNTDPL